MKSLLLGDQAQLAWNEYGASDGEPVFFFHGTPGSRLQASPADDIARDLGLRLIAPERPGYGDSDAQEHFDLLDWANSVSLLANNLNLEQFSILGYSAGGAYALACGRKMTERIKHITLVGSLAPFETAVMQQHINAAFKPLYELAAADTHTATQQLSQLASSPEALLEVMQSQLPPCDQAIFSQALFRKNFTQNLALAIRQGVKGTVNDFRNLALPWQFNLEDIYVPIDIWHGQDDNNCGIAVGRYLAEALNSESTHFPENKGHFFLFEQWHEILVNLKRKAA
jgi:pimeloyl-ACP methyl ester carboxylesterase